MINHGNARGVRLRDEPFISQFGPIVLLRISPQNTPIILLKVADSSLV